MRKINKVFHNFHPELVIFHHIREPIYDTKIVQGLFYNALFRVFKRPNHYVFAEFGSADGALAVPVYTFEKACRTERVTTLGDANIFV